MTDRLNLTLDIQASRIGLKRVNVRANLLTASLIANIKDKWNLDGNYEVRLAPQHGGLAETKQALSLEMPLDQAGVVEGATLVCERIQESSGTADLIQRGTRTTFSKNFQRIYLQEERRLTEFDLAWQPAIIGRRDQHDPSKNKLLAAPLDDLEEGNTVSRHHACLTEKSGAFFIEALNPDNATYLGGQRLRPHMPYPIEPGESIQLGRITLKFYVVS